MGREKWKFPLNILIRDWRDYNSLGMLITNKAKICQKMLKSPDGRPTECQCPGFVCFIDGHTREVWPLKLWHDKALGSWFLVQAADLYALTHLRCQQGYKQLCCWERHTEFPLLNWVYTGHQHWRKVKKGNWLLNKINKELPYDPDSTPTNRPKIVENKCSNKSLYVNVDSSTIHNSEKVETCHV